MARVGLAYVNRSLQYTTNIRGDEFVFHSPAEASFDAAESYYVMNGEPTSELRMVRDALRVGKELYGMLPAEKFGPLKLKAVREEMIRLGWCRRQINKRGSTS